MAGPFTAADFGSAGAAPTAPPPSDGLWTADDFAPTPPQPQSGAAHDIAWSSGAGGRILNAAGYGAQNEWGATPLGLSPEAEAGLRKAGVFNDYKDGHTSFIKSVNEALIRPAAAVADFAQRGFGIPAVAGAISGGLQQAQQELQGAHPVIGGVLGGAGELAGGFAEGAFIGGAGEGIPHAAETARVNDAARARSVGALGEGEAGFYGAEPLTPENIQARADAARDAGSETPPPAEPPAPDIHVLARRIDPETFQEFDALALERDQHRATLAAIGDEREQSPEAVEARTQIETILGKVNGVEDRLTNAAAQRLADAQQRLDDALRTPAEDDARNKLLQADFAMRDLAPAVSEAYRRAADMAPQLAEEGGADASIETPQATETASDKSGAEERLGLSEQPHPIAVQASEEATGLTPTASVTGDEKLGEGGTTESAGPRATKPESAVGPGPGRYGGVRAVQGTGEEKFLGLSKSAEASAIEKGLTEAFDLPTYQVKENIPHLEKVVDFMDGDWEHAKSVALGERAPPKDILPNAVYVGVYNRALERGDVDTIRRLSTQSKLLEQTKTQAQNIQILSRLRGGEIGDAIQEVQAAREADLAKRTDIQAAKRETVADIKKEVRAAASKKDAWESFITSIKC